MQFGHRWRTAVCLAAILILNPTRALAEVMDKEPSLASIWSMAVLIVVLALSLSRWRPWLALLVWIPAVPMGAALLLEVHDPFVGPAILAEAGWTYVVQAHIAAAMLIAAPPATLLWSKFKSPVV